MSRGALLTLSPLKAVMAQLMQPLILLEIPNERTVRIRTGKCASPLRMVYLAHKFLGMMEEGEKKMVRSPE